MIASHLSTDFSEHFLAEYLAARGVGFLGWNTRYRGNERCFLVDRAVSDIGVGVRWMREVAGIETIVLLGNSGGGSLMAAYQSQALSPNLRPTWDLPEIDSITDLVPGDLMVLLAAHPGRHQLLATSIDGAVTDENDPTAFDPQLDIYNPENHGPETRPRFGAVFVAAIRAAQTERINRIDTWVKSELVDLANLGMRDRLFVINRVWADPRFVDPLIDLNRRVPNSCVLGDPAAANDGITDTGIVTSLRSWLSLWSPDSQCAALAHLTRLHVPTLSIEADSDSSVFPSDGDAMFDAIAADDKTRMIRTGDHFFRTPAGARDRLCDALIDWVRPRTN